MEVNRSPERSGDLSRDARSKCQACVNRRCYKVTRQEQNAQLNFLAQKSITENLAPGLSNPLLSLYKLRYMYRHFILKTHFCLSQRPNHQLYCYQLLQVHSESQQGGGSSQSILLRTCQGPWRTECSGIKTRTRTTIHAPADVQLLQLLSKQAFVSVHLWLFKTHLITVKGPHWENGLI